MYNLHKVELNEIILKSSKCLGFGYLGQSAQEKQFSSTRSCTNYAVSNELTVFSLYWCLFLHLHRGEILSSTLFIFAFGQRSQCFTVVVASSRRIPSH